MDVRRRPRPPPRRAPVTAEDPADCGLPAGARPPCAAARRPGRCGRPRLVSAPMRDERSPGHVHVERHRIVMSEVDVAQIHFTTLFRWMDRSFCEWLADVGRPFTQLLEEGPGIPVVDAHCRYVARVRLDDIVTIRTHLSEAGRS